MAFTLLKNNFTGGEWSPRLEGRSDLQGYGSACRKMENMRPMVHGGAVMRGGLEFVAECYNQSKPVRLIPFTFSTNTRYVLELGHTYVRGRRGHDASVAFLLTTPYKDDEVFELQFRQVNDVMYLVHPQYAPRKLSRFSDTNWQLTEVMWDYPPLRDENTDEGVQLKFENGTLSAQGGNVFESGHVGGYFELRHLKQSDGVEVVLFPMNHGDDWWPGAGQVRYSPVLAVRGDWEFTTTEFWWGTIYLERSRDGGATWEVMRQWSGSADRNISASGKIDDEDAEQLMRIRYLNKGNPFTGAIRHKNQDPPDGWTDATARLETKDIYVKGLVRVTGVSNGTTAQAVVVGKHSPASTDWTDRWSEGAWSAHRGFPRTVAFFEQRMLYAGNRSQPQRVWGSRGSDFENFRYGDEDDAGVAFDIASTEGNPILWMEGLQRILIGTSGGEFTMSGAAGGEAPLTPSSVLVRRVSSYGSKVQVPIAANEGLIFVQRQGKKLREWVFSLQREGEGAPDLCVQAEHFFGSRAISDLAFVRWPDPSIAVALGDCLGWLTYDKESGIQAWSRYTSGMDAQFESVCGVYGEPIDEVWCVVRRKVGATWKRFIERFVPEATTKEEARYLDCHKSGVLPYDWSWPVHVGTHLNGEQVRLYLGGMALGDFSVIDGFIIPPPKWRVGIKEKWAKWEADYGSGASLPLRRYCVGIPYKGVIETMRLELDGESGSSAGKARRIHKLTLRFQNTGQGVKYGRSGGGRMEEVIFRDAVDPTDGTPPLSDDEKVAQFPLGHDRAARVLITQENPLPFTLLGLAVTAEITQQ